MTPLVALDTETDGVHPGRRVWEVAMIRRDDEGQRERHFFVALDLRHSDPFGLEIGGFWDRHPAGRKMSGRDGGGLPSEPVLSSHDAAKEVMRWTFGAHIIGAVPNFDTEVLAGLLRSQGYLPAWHYHLIDVEAMAVGWLNADRAGKHCRHGRQRAIHGDEINARGGARAECLDCGRWLPHLPLVLPWKSDDLSRACGVEPPSDTERHTALGDARWALRWYDAMTGGAK